MKTLFYNSATKKISFDNTGGFMSTPDNTTHLSLFENIISYPFLCILGVIKITAESKYLFFCVEDESLGVVQKEEIYAIKKVNYLQLTDHNQNDVAENIKNLIETLNFYYTFEEIEEHFLWNGDMIKNFREFTETECNAPLVDSSSSKSLSADDIPYKFKNIKTQNKTMRSPFSSKYEGKDKPEKLDFSKMAIGNMVCGYFESRSIRENGMLHYIKIFSKISIKKIGTRMLSRGVDEYGKVSFFVETKFIVKNDVERVEFVILRGSVPLYWSQDDPLKPHKIIFDIKNKENDQAFKTHMEKLQNGYGRIVVVNLLGQNKYEKQLSKQYKHQCQENNIDYVHFDLNKHAVDIENIKTIFYKQLNSFMTELKDKEQDNLDLKFQNVGYKKTSVCKDFDIQQPGFINSINKDEEGGLNTSDASETENDWSESNDLITNEPDSSAFTELDPQNNDFNDLKITFRVNCMDCLDRTNIAQYLIFNFFDKFKFPVARSMWANNGNALSKMYTGSDALKSELHAKGKLSVLGRMNDLVISANRMINNRFTDKDKQNVIDIILGKKCS